MATARVNEFELIARLAPTLASNPSVHTGAGDDCAAVDAGIPNKLLLLKTDAIVAGVHFTADAPAEKVGHKALARCLSDIAAMGGTPAHALITIGLPADFDVEFVEGVYRGLNDLARRYHVAIVGGETTTCPERLFISVCVTGTVAKDKMATRSAARVGDGIFVTGELGGSIAGKHLDFEPRLAEGRWLVENFPVHAMIDLSDGLAGDLRHIIQASNVGAEILAPSIPISRAAKLASRSSSLAKPPLVAALTDGEDFELLFTVPSAQAVPLLDAWKKQFPDQRLTLIGKVTPGPGLTLRDKTGTRPLNAEGYVHFSKS